MGARFRGISEGLREKYDSGEIQTGLIRDLNFIADTVYDPKVFEPWSQYNSKYERHVEDHYRMGTINLYVPIVNPFLAGKGYPIWSILTGLKKSDIQDINSGKVFLHADTLVPLTPDEMHNENYDPKKFITGYEALACIVQDRNLENVIKGELTETYLKPFLLPKTEFPGEIKDYKEASPEQEPGWLIDNYVYIPDKEYPYDYDKETYDSFEDALRSHVVQCAVDLSQKPKSTIAVLLKHKRNPNKLAEQKMTYLYVLPVAYRPLMDGRVDYLSVLYSDVVRQTKQLETLLNYSNPKVEQVSLMCQNIFSTINTIIYNDANNKNIPESYKCLVERMKDKNALIRNYMYASRTDNSGRTVIICDPEMSIDTIGVPYEMLYDLAEQDILKYYKENRNVTPQQLTTLMNSRERGSAVMKRVLRELAKSGLRIPIGRQPTLWNLGYQAYKFKPVEGHAIIVPALIVEPFNADFDGDQMHIEWPNSDRAKYETANLMNSTKNIFYPKDGTLTTLPRLEVLYGLWDATQLKLDNPDTYTQEQIMSMSEYTKNSSTEDDSTEPLAIEKAVYGLIIKNKIKLNDIIKISSTKYEYQPGVETTAGLVALKYCFGPKKSSFAIGALPLIEYSKGGKDTAITDKWVAAVMCKDNSVLSESYYVRTMNNMARLGFAIARWYPPSVAYKHKVNRKELLDQFYAKIKTQEELLKIGFISESAFNDAYSKYYAEFNDTLRDKILDELGQSDGYYLMFKSHARGNASNLAQIFGVKGRGQKNAVENFNFLIDRPLIEQLSAMEILIAAYGARQGIIDKVLSVEKPGYSTRKTANATAKYSIVTKDCGDTEGLVWTYDDLTPFTDNKVRQSQETYEQAREVFRRVVMGKRPIIQGYTQPPILSEHDADFYFEKYIAKQVNNPTATYKIEILPGLPVRSPVTCKCPICATCYGYDFQYHQNQPTVGRPVGIIAAQTISQAPTQSTMKKFQKGGVASGKQDSFAEVMAFLGMTSKDGVDYNDPIAITSGDVVVVERNNVYKVAKIRDYKNKLKGNYLVPAEIELKDEVVEGEPIWKSEGRHSIVDVIKSYEYHDAAKYFIAMAGEVIGGSANIMPCYFETLYLSLTFYLLLKPVGPFSTGEYVTPRQLYLYNIDSYAVVPVVVGYGRLPAYRSDFLGCLNLEAMSSYLPRAFYMNGNDELDDPKIRMLFGLEPRVGTNVNEHAKFNYS